MKLTTKNLLTIAAIGVGIYLAWKFWATIKQKAAAAVDAVAAPIADAYSSLTLPGDVELIGNVRLPNGTEIPLNSLNVEPSTMSFTYLGNRYRIDHREGDAYIAKNVL
jgi:hypothetical protein